MIPNNITKEHIIKALVEIDKRGVPKGRGSRKFLLVYEGKHYPPKYVVSEANRIANGRALDSGEFGGGEETNGFLRSRGFIVIESSESGKSKEVASKVKRTRKARRHDERCPRCKETIETMLEKAFGEVKPNHQFLVGSRVEDWKDTGCHNTLQEILLKLQVHRGHEDFIRAGSLPRCDFFVPNPGFIVEFDESQHFTAPRRIALQCYGKAVKVGFSLQKWLGLCESIGAKDDTPPDRDEARAWYDTLRDFMPTRAALGPTVRLYAGEMQWCGLNPDNPGDVKSFKDMVERKAANSLMWVATVIQESEGKPGNNDRLEALAEVVKRVCQQRHSPGVILFPGGWFSAGQKKASSIYEWVEEKVCAVLSEAGRDLVVCTGIDGQETDNGAKDQIGAAINRDGIIALGRKFHPAPAEKEYVELAEDHTSSEDGYPRAFDLNGRRFFICACYDSFGIKHKGISNFGIDVVLDLIHGFYPKGDGNSGDVYFAKHGLAGASKHWGCPAFGAAVFFKREIPPKWPSGVMWNQRNKSTQNWRYSDNPMKPLIEFHSSVREGRVNVRIFDLSDRGGVRS